MPNSWGTSLLGLRDAYPNLIVVRTASKAYALAGLRVGFAVARPEVIARLNPFRPPGSISTVSVTLVTEALRDDSILDDNLARVETERTRLTEGLRAVGWKVGPSVTNFVLVDLGSTERAAAVAEGLLPVASCRGRSAPAIRSPTTSGSRSVPQTRTTGSSRPPRS